MPPWLQGLGQGLGHRRVLDAAGIVARARRPRSRARASRAGRTQEIQRLIGRSLRAVTDLRAMPEVQITVDCDVLQADGGTRTASICGGWIALHDACSRLLAEGHARPSPGRCSRCAAISVGVIDGTPMLDLEYSEDVRAEVDMNVVMTGDGRFVEVQGTAEGVAFTRAELDALLGLAESGIAEIVAAQQEMVAEAPTPRSLMTGLPLPFVLATGNADKVREIIEIFVDRDRRAARRVRARRRRDDLRFLLERPDAIVDAVHALPALAVAPDVEETGATLEENARIKASALCARHAACRRSPTTPASRSTRSTARRASTRRGTRATTRPTPTTSPSCCASSKACTPRCAPRGSRRLRSRAGPTGARSRCAARSRA